MKIIRFVLLLIHLLVISLLLGNFLNVIISPKTFPYFNFLALAFPVLIVLDLILILFWVVLCKKRAFFFIFISLFFIKPVSRIVNYHPENKETPNLKVITLNPKMAEFGKEKIEAFINKENPDIVFLQEAGWKKNIYDFKNLEYQDIHHLIFFYSKYKIIATKNWIVNENAYAKSYDLEIKNKTYRFINIYLEPFYLEKSMLKPSESTAENENKLKNLIKKMAPNFKAHQEQISAARKAIEDSPYPIIMAGDFNSVPNSYEYYHLGKNLQDVFEAVGSGSATSFYDYKFPIRIDYVFASKNIKPISYKVDRTAKISDHFPVIATFLID